MYITVCGALNSDLLVFLFVFISPFTFVFSSTRGGGCVGGLLQLLVTFWLFSDLEGKLKNKCKEPATIKLDSSLSNFFFVFVVFRIFPFLRHEDTF